MPSAVLDLQGFQLSPHSFVVKELSCVDEYGYYALWTFKPPYAWDTISPRRQRSYDWVTRNHHGLAWTHGDIPYKALKSVLKQIFETYTCLYVKGLEKTKFLKTFTKMDIVNLEELPKPLPVSRLTCPLHTTDSFSCALKKEHSYAMALQLIKTGTS
ncbi:hypothetical protein RF55_21313 [Lasius niger]|uniref:Uncharacterized protein n=1 Tax=Lasius niger TaxID=67767 RepID=A0A0J7JXR4_LASNI|nr:hypothetical protein RF55_21313 [Lasius niger]